MSESLLPLLSSGLWLAVLCSLPVLLIAVLSAVITAWLQARLGITDSSLPVAVRLLLGMATLFVLGPYLVAKLVVFATTVWSALPSLR
jgi:flagellar biosynthesis protein FliQ